MNKQLIQGISIDWSKVDESSYLRNIEAIIVTHSPILLGIPNAEILTFDDGSIHRCKYEETDSYQVMEMFINHREQLLERMLMQQVSE